MYFFHLIGNKECIWQWPSMPVKKVVFHAPTGDQARPGSSQQTRGFDKEINCASASLTASLPCCGDGRRSCCGGETNTSVCAAGLTVFTQTLHCLCRSCCVYESACSCVLRLFPLRLSLLARCFISAKPSDRMVCIN